MYQTDKAIKIDKKNLNNYAIILKIEINYYIKFK